MPSAPSASDFLVGRVAVTDPEATYEDAPSREELLKRAAELGARRTWESIVLHPTDPILGEKMKPRVRERRARFRRIVKVALGACVAFCVFVIAASGLSTNNLANAASSASIGKTAPASATIPVEKLDMPTRGKAVNRLTAAARPAPTPKSAWGMKRH